MCTAFSAFFLVISIASGADSPEFAWVLSSKGTWIDRAAQNAVVHKNYRVRADSKLFCTDTLNGKSALVLKVRLNGNTREFSCADRVTCDRELDLAPLLPPKNKNFPEFLFAFFTGGSDALDKQLERVRVVLSRSGASQQVLREAIIPVGTDLSSADLFLPSAKQGAYQLEICPFRSDDPSKGCPDQKSPFEFSLSSGKATPVATKNRPTGVYLVVRWDDGLRTPDRALLWIAPPDKARPARRQLEEANSVLAGWSNQNDARDHLAAFLLYLSLPEK